MRNPIANLVARAIVRLVGDSGSRQTAQLEITKDELMADVPRIQNFGFTSVPPASGTDAIVLFLNGDRERGVIVGMENMGLRVKNLAEGDVAIYDSRGNVIKLTEEGIEVTALVKATVSAPEVVLQAGGSSVTVTPASVDIVSPLLTHNGKDIGATHRHSGVTSGPSNTGVPV